MAALSGPPLVPDLTTPSEGPEKMKAMAMIAHMWAIDKKGTTQFLNRLAKRFTPRPPEEPEYPEYLPPPPPQWGPRGVESPTRGQSPDLAGL